MRALLLGPNGQVGWELQRSLAPLGEVWSLDRQSPHGCGDLARVDALVQTVSDYKPDVVVNAAAYTAVDQAESDVEAAHAINAVAPAALAQACRSLGALLVHYSTDYVFDGSGTTPRTETAATAPLNVYGRTKLEGERAVVESGCRHLIFRTSWVYGSRGGNFAKTMLRLAKERAQLKVIDDQFGAPTGADLIADVTAHAIKHLAIGEAMDKTREQESAGIYHLVASGETTWHAYAQFVIDAAKRLQPDAPWQVSEVLPVDSAAFETPARRPLYSRLDNTLLQRTFGLTLPDWQCGVSRLLTEVCG